MDLLEKVEEGATKRYQFLWHRKVAWQFYCLRSSLGTCHPDISKGGPLGACGVAS